MADLRHLQIWLWQCCTILILIKKIQFILNKNNSCRNVMLFCCILNFPSPSPQRVCTPQYLNQMVTQKILRMYEEKQDFLQNKSPIYYFFRANQMPQPDHITGVCALPAHLFPSYPISLSILVLDQSFHSYRTIVFTHTQMI